MTRRFVTQRPLREFPLWEKQSRNRIPLGFDLEITARCNHNCRHCAVNLPAGDRQAGERELPLEEWENIADQAVKMGALWCLLTGGEPLLRKDFADIYRMLKGKGLLVSVFTNATRVTTKHVELFSQYPPRDVEITVYGVTRETYEKVTRIPGSFRAFQRGINRLRERGIPLRLKAMALRSNYHELPQIAAFCRRYTRDFFRFDPLLHLRYDGNRRRNREIEGERLTPEEIVRLEQGDPERYGLLKKHCNRLIGKGNPRIDCAHLFTCGAGNGGFTVSPEGIFRLCPSLWHPDCVYDLKRGTLAEAWNGLAPRVRSLTSRSPDYLKNCAACPVMNLCLWCPAHAHLEGGRLDGWSEYFCRVAHSRARALGEERDLPPLLNRGKGT